MINSMIAHNNQVLQLINFMEKLSNSIFQLYRSPLNERIIDLLLMNPIESTLQTDSAEEQRSVKKVILLGTEGVGKSKLLLRYLYGAFEER